MLLNLIKYFVYYIFFIFIFPSIGFSQSNHPIQKVTYKLYDQADAWNKGDIDGFMESYWKSEELQFIGSKGVTFGWKQTLSNYKKSYPSKEAMGKLSFEVIKTDLLSKKVIMMSGKFKLDRPKLGDLEGHFLLVWKKIKGKWYIIADHTS